jgi:ElaB/YqjD/DUF883 family membrane-anchored ribosome-binding protein
MSQYSDTDNGQRAGEPRPAQATRATPKSPEQIREEIARTRSALSQDVAALGEKLRPEHLKENAREMLHEAKDAAKEGAKDVIREAKDAAVESLRYAKDHAIDSISETYHDVSQRVQDAGGATAVFVSTHAIPLSLVGVGVGWLALSVGHARRQQLGDFGARYDRALAAGSDTRGPARGAARAARENAGDVTDHVTHVSSEHGEHRAERVGALRSQVVQRATDVGRRTADLGHRAYDGVGRASERARDFGEENPLAVGLLALAAGIGVGLLLPPTRRENQLLGATRDRLAQDARRTASELGRSVQRSASELRGALGEE